MEVIQHPGMLWEVIIFTNHLEQICIYSVCIQVLKSNNRPQFRKRSFYMFMMFCFTAGTSC